MRVADGFRYELYKTNLSILKEKMDNTSTKVASGRRVLVPSDDPASFSKNMELDAQKNANTQFKRNLNALAARGKYYETSINTITDLLTRAKELAVQMASDTVDAQSRAGAAEEIDGIIESLAAVGNTKVGNTYIFGGKNSDTAPYTFDETTSTWSFNGTADVTKVSVDASRTMDSGISGERIFGVDTGLFTSLGELRAALKSNDLAGIQTGMDSMDAWIDQTATNLTYVGTYNRKVDTVIATNETREITLTETSASLMEADTVQLITDYNALSTAYQAAALTLSKVQNLTILNYMR
jgi:flagellar hook-associated protein 3 FlgL